MQKKRSIKIDSFSLTPFGPKPSKRDLSMQWHVQTVHMHCTVGPSHSMRLSMQQATIKKIKSRAVKKIVEFSRDKSSEIRNDSRCYFSTLDEAINQWWS